MFQELAAKIQSDLRENMPVWREKYPGVEALQVAVMGCIVNGPGESKHADIGISLPGTGETPTAPVFVDGRKAATLRGPAIAEDFQRMVADYIEARFGGGSRLRNRTASGGRLAKLGLALGIFAAAARHRRFPRPRSGPSRSPGPATSSPAMRR